MPGPGGAGKKEKPKNAWGTMKRILHYLLQYRWVVLVLLGCSLVSNVGNLLGPSFAGKAIRAAAAGPGQVDFSTVFYYAKCMLCAYLVGNVLSFLINQGMMRLSRRVAEQMRSDVFHKLTLLPVSYFDRHAAGDIISRVSYDIDVVSTCLSTDVVQIFSSVLSVVGSFVMMCVISPAMVCCMLVTIPMAIFYTSQRGKKTRPLYARRSAAYGVMNGYVEEMFNGQKTILAYAYEKDVCRDFSKINQEAADAYCVADTMGVTMGPTVAFINNLGLSLIGLVGSLLYYYSKVDLGQISSFVLYSRKFSGPINEIADIINEIFSALAAAERVFTLLDQPEEPADAPQAESLGQVDGEVELDRVSFGYEPGQEILHGLSLHALPGQTVAIVGHTGAGKTTIINLLMRFYDPQSGSICVDGREIESLTRTSLRRAYAMVLQDTWVFRGSIFDNIAYGKEGATREEVEAAAKAARIHSTILRLPQGYDTVISEGGGNISKGQKQLLTIARAMLYDTQMLVLDEATSNVDTTTEQQVQRAMQEMMKGRTSFVIAHRLSTIQNADQILVMDGGNVVEQGTHESLMARRGYYYKLYAAQFE